MKVSIIIIIIIITGITGIIIVIIIVMIIIYLPCLVFGICGISLELAVDIWFKRTLQTLAYGKCESWYVCD